MINELIDQVEYFMQQQKLKEVESKSHYAWLSSRKIKVKIPFREDEQIRKVASKMTPEQLTNVLKQIDLLIKSQPDLESQQVPTTCLKIMIDLNTKDIIQDVTNKRAGSFRRLSLPQNKVAPSNLRAIGSTKGILQRSVSFKEECTVYSIS